jgi:hypothetical protein
MTALQLTRHGFQRMCQRGFSDTDIDLVMMFGSEVPEGYLLTQRIGKLRLGFSRPSPIAFPGWRTPFLSLAREVS